MEFDAARHVQEVIAGLVSLAFPPHCAVCGVAADDPLCPACRAALPPAIQPTLAEVAWFRAACRYAGAAKACVRRLKYDARLELAPPMAARMLAAARIEPTFPADVIVPVPLHAVRARERTFNQAAALAVVVGRGLGSPVRPEALARRRATAPQSSLAGLGRSRNVAGAFVVRRPALVRGRRIVLIDDVVTTGATARACVRALRAAGAAEIGLLTFAHG